MTKPHINHTFTKATYALPVVVYEKNKQSILSHGSRILRARTTLGSARTIRTLSRDNDSRVLPLDDLRYLGAEFGFEPK